MSDSVEIPLVDDDDPEVAMERKRCDTVQFIACTHIRTLLTLITHFPYLPAYTRILPYILLTVFPTSILLCIHAHVYCLM